MIIQYRFAVQSDDKRTLTDSMAYPLYAWLLTQTRKDYADILHQQGEKPVSQYLCHRNGKSVWTVSCLNSEASAAFQPVLENLSVIPLHSGIIKADLTEVCKVNSLEDLTSLARKKIAEPYCRIVFASPTSFRHDGQYVIFPQTRLLFRSLVEKWNDCYPDYPLDDPKTLDVIEQSLKLTDYRLQSCRFFLKGVRIPGFQGQVSIYSALPAPLMDIWKSLIYFSEFSGIGMKTTLGMGGVYFL